MSDDIGVIGALLFIVRAAFNVTLEFFRAVFRAETVFFKLNLVTLEFRAQLFGDRSVIFHDWRGIMWSCWGNFFCGGYVECHFYRHCIPYFYLYQFLFFFG